MTSGAPEDVGRLGSQDVTNGSETCGSFGGEEREWRIWRKEIGAIRAQRERDMLVSSLKRLSDEVERLRSFEAYANGLIAGFRRTFRLRTMSRKRRILRYFLPAPFKPRWDAQNLDRLVAIVEQSGLFDSDWYRATYPEASDSGLAPIRDYLAIGASLGRRPRADFDPDLYASERPQLAFLGLDPFVHFIVEGASTINTPPKSHSDDAMSVDPATEPRDVSCDPKLLDELDAAGGFNGAWYGGRELRPDERFISVVGSNSCGPEAEPKRPVTSPHRWTDSDDAVMPSAAENLRKASPAAYIRSAFTAAKPNDDVAASRPRPCNIIVTVVHGEACNLTPCAVSIERAMAAAPGRIRWILINDAPGLTNEALHRKLPAALGQELQIVPADRLVGGSGAFADIIDARAGDWVVPLDHECAVEPHICEVLDFYIAKFVKCRRIVAGTVDVDEEDRLLRRVRNIDPTRWFEAGDGDLGLMAIRIDRFVTHFDQAGEDPTGYLDAMRHGIEEPCLVVPDYLRRRRIRTDADPAVRFPRVISVLRHFLLEWADRISPAKVTADGPRHPPLKAGLCIIRTQGKRLELLSETVGSVLMQTRPITPLIVVHGPPDVEAAVKAWQQKCAPGCIVLSAPDVASRRGHPMNVGLDYAREHANDYDFICFLDDDDIFYPLYSERLAELMDLTGCDVAVGNANSRIPWEPPKRAHEQLPASALVFGNFIPIHAYIVRTSFLVGNQVHVPEDMDYLEDWDFLVGLLGFSARFAMSPETLCEFRVISDGNLVAKRDPSHFEDCSARVSLHARRVASRLGMARLLRDIATFEFEGRPQLSNAEVMHMTQVGRIFAEVGTCEE